MHSSSAIQNLRIGLVGAAMCASASVASAQLNPVVVIERGDAADILVSEKDAGLVRAMRLLPDRLRDLPRDSEGNIPEEFAEYADLLVQGLSARWRFGLVFNEDEPNAGFFGYGFIASLESQNRDFPVDLDNLVTGLIRDQGEMEIEPSERFDSLSQVFTPAGPVEFGPMQLRDAWAYRIISGPIDRPEDAFSGLPSLPAGVTPQLRGVVDFSQFGPMVEAVQLFAGGPNEQVDMVLETLGSLGLVGDDAMKLSFWFGEDGEQSLGEVRMAGARQFASELSLPTRPLTGDHLLAIPADATAASMSQVDFSMFEDILDQMADAGAPVDDMLAELREMTGVDLRRDILQTLGGACGGYLSRTTGGGGMLSGVFLIEVQDHARFARAHGRLVDFANEAIQGQLEYAPEIFRNMGLKSWRHDGQEFMSFRFDGVPIPFEPTYALTKDWLIVGLTPQATVAAVAQAEGKLGDGFGWFAEAYDGDIYGLTYNNTGEFMQRGYQWITLVGSAIANGVRSPDRDPGLAVPLYAELAAGARPSISAWQWEGDDFIMRSSGDRSLLVQMAGLAGVAQEFAPLLAAGAAAIGGARQGGFDGFGLIEPADLLDNAMRGFAPSPFGIVAANLHRAIDKPVE